MKVDLNINKQTNFQAHVSPKFENILREYINMGPNRLKNHYKLSQKIEEINNCGYDNHTIELLDNYVGWGREYILFSVPDGASVKNGIFIDKKHSLGQIFNRFMDLRVNELINKIKSNAKWRDRKWYNK